MRNYAAINLASIFANTLTYYTQKISNFKKQATKTIYLLFTNLVLTSINRQSLRKQAQARCLLVIR